MKLLLFGLMLFMAGEATASPQNSVVMMVISPTSPRSGGTGFEVEAPSGRVYTLTNAHVCALSADGYMYALSETRSAIYSGLRIIKTDPENDLCVLEPIPHPEAIKLGKEPHPMQAITIIGHPRLRPLTVSRGIITRMVAGEVLSNAIIEPGNSGSPALDNSGKLAAIVCAIMTNTGEAILVSVDVVRGFLTGL